MRAAAVVALLLLQSCATVSAATPRPVPPNLDALLRGYVGVTLWDCSQAEPQAWVRIHIDGLRLAGVTEDGRLWVHRLLIRTVLHEQVHLAQIAETGCAEYERRKQMEPGFAERMEAEAMAAEGVVPGR